MEPRARASQEQFHALIDFMERHGDLSRPQPGAQGRLRGDRLWNDLTTMLNSIGGGVEKSQDKWKKVWADWKTKTKKKISIIRRHASSTGGGPSNRQTLTSLEERIISVIGVSAVVGQVGIEEQGFNAPSLSAEEPSGSEIQIVLDVPHANISLPPPSVPLASTSTPLVDVSQPEGSQPNTTRLAPAQTPPRRASASPRSTAATPRRRLLASRARRNRGLTPFDRAASEFVAVEQRRLRLEEERERLLHERELERLRLESQRIEATREHNQLLRQFLVLAQRLLDVLPQHLTTGLPSTDPLPDTE